MRALAVLAALCLPALQGAAQGLQLSIPSGVPDAVGLGWTRITGDVATTSDGVVYELFVNPARGAIYEVVRYRYRVGSRAQAEKLLWNRHPSGGMGPVCFTHERDGSWRQLQNGSTEYRDELITALRVYSLHRKARLGE